MEESGMAGRRRRFISTGLLTVILFIATLLLPVAVPAEEDGNGGEGRSESGSGSGSGGPQVILHHSHRDLVAGTTWTLIMIVSHNFPNQVSTTSPPFPEEVTLSQMRKGIRFVNPAKGDWGTTTIQSRGPLPVPEKDEGDEEEEDSENVYEQWTAIEYRFLLTDPGIVEFEPFIVTTPQGRTVTEPFVIYIREPHRVVVERPRYRVSWGGLPAEMTVGESVTLTLSVSSSRQIPSIPAPEQFIPVVPHGFILEFIALSQEEKNTELAAKMRLIPLTAVPFSLDRLQLPFGGGIFEVPSVRIPVRRLAENTAGVQENIILPEPEPETEITRHIVPFPLLAQAVSVHTGLYNKHRAECDIIYDEAKSLWARGYMADAIAVLRKNERDHRARAFFAAIRREAELTLGLISTNNERRPFLFFRNKRSRVGVLKETTVHRIPDSSGTEIARFLEGQPVTVLNENNRTRTENSVSNESWLRVTANDNTGISGWVPVENIIFY